MTYPATAGNRGTATAGDEGILVLKYWDQKKQRWRLAVGYVGEDDLLPNTPYVVRDGQIVSKDSHSGDQQ